MAPSNKYLAMVVLAPTIKYKGPTTKYKIPTTKFKVQPSTTRKVTSCCTAIVGSSVDVMASEQYLGTRRLFACFVHHCCALVLILGSWYLLLFAMPPHPVLYATGQQGGAAQLLSAYQHLDGFMAAKHYRQNCNTKFMKANHILLAIAHIIGKNDPKIFPTMLGSRINSIGWPRPQVATSHFRSCLFKVFQPFNKFLVIHPFRFSFQRGLMFHTKKGERHNGDILRVHISSL